MVIADFPTALVAICVVLVSSTLLLSAATKAGSPSHIQLSLAELGFLNPRRTARLLLVAEFALAVAVSVIGEWLVASGVAILGISFAMAGLVSLRREKPIVCNCFGRIGKGTLGWSQIVALPLWLLASFVVSQMPPYGGLRERLTLLSVAASAATVPIVRSLWIARKTAREGRMELAEQMTMTGIPA